MSVPFAGVQWQMMDCLVLPVYMRHSCFRLLHARRRQTVSEEEKDGVQGAHIVQQQLFLSSRCCIHAPQSWAYLLSIPLVAKVKFTINTFANKERQHYCSCQGLAGDSRSVRAWNLQGWSYSTSLLLRTLSCDGNELDRSDVGKQQENQQKAKGISVFHCWQMLSSDWIRILRDPSSGLQPFAHVQRLPVMPWQPGLCEHSAKGIVSSMASTDPNEPTDTLATLDKEKFLLLKADPSIPP